MKKEPAYPNERREAKVINKNTTWHEKNNVKNGLVTERVYFYDFVAVVNLDVGIFSTLYCNYEVWEQYV